MHPKFKECLTKSLGESLFPVVWLCIFFSVRVPYTGNSSFISVVFQLLVKPGKDTPDMMILQVVLAAASPVPA